MKSIFSKSRLFCLWQWLQGISLSLSMSLLTFSPSVMLRRESKQAAGQVSGSQSRSIIQLQLWYSINYRNILQITHCTCKAEEKGTHLIDKKFKMSQQCMLTAQKSPFNLGSIKEVWPACQERWFSHSNNRCGGRCAFPIERGWN